MNNNKNGIYVGRGATLIAHNSGPHSIQILKAGLVDKQKHREQV